MPCAYGRGEVADDGIEAEASLDRFGLEPALQPIARAHREQIQDIAPGLHVHRPEPLRRFPRLQQVVDAAADIGRRLQHQFAQQVGDAFQPLVGYAGSASASRREWRATSACVAARPPPTFRWSPSGSGRKPASGRNTMDRPCCASRRSRTMRGCNRLTV